MFDVPAPWKSSYDRSGPPSLFWLRELTRGDMMYVDGGFEPGETGGGTRLLRLLLRGIKKITNFVKVDDPEDITEVVDALPWHVREEAAVEIYKRSTVDKGFEAELRAAVRTAHLRSKVKDKSVWDCETCMQNPKLQKQRACPIDEFGGASDAKTILDKSKFKYLRSWDKKNLAAGKLKPWLTFGGHQYDQCPIGIATSRAYKMLDLVFKCEDKQVMPVAPPAWTSQPEKFCHAASIIDGERGAIEKAKKDGQTVDPIDVGKRRQQFVESGSSVEERLKREADVNRLGRDVPIRRVPLGARTPVAT